MEVLVVEDDPRLAAVLRRGLAEIGHVVDVESDSVAGEFAGRDPAYDVIVLDVMLPERDGFSVAHALRSSEMQTPILMLTARARLATLFTGSTREQTITFAKPSFSPNSTRACGRTCAVCRHP